MEVPRIYRIPDKERATTSRQWERCQVSLAPVKLIYPKPSTSVIMNAEVDASFDPPRGVENRGPTGGPRIGKSLWRPGQSLILVVPMNPPGGFRYTNIFDRAIRPPDPDTPIVAIGFQSIYSIESIELLVPGMFTPVNTTLGSLLLFQGSSGLLIHNGAVFGISSLISGSVLNPNSDNVPIIAGLISSVIPVYFLVPSLIPHYPQFPDSLYSVAATLVVGFLLGWGTKVRHMLMQGT